jgi:hypothetical protein
LKQLDALDERAQRYAAGTGPGSELDSYLPKRKSLFGLHSDVLEETRDQRTNRKDRLVQTTYRTRRVYVVDESFEEQFNCARCSYGC